MFLVRIGCGHARTAWPGNGISTFGAAPAPRALMLASLLRARQGIRRVTMTLQYILFNLMQMLGRLDACLSCAGKPRVNALPESPSPRAVDRRPRHACRSRD